MKKQIQSEGRVVLYELRNDRTESRVKCLGYEVAILSETGKVQESWQYVATELRWAKAGYKTLIGAQARGALDNRSRWKPYKPNCRVPHSPGIVRPAEVDGPTAKNHCGSCLEHPAQIRSFACTRARQENMLT